jgi:hypothetical protein
MRKMTNISLESVMDRAHLRIGNACKIFRLKLKIPLNFAERMNVKCCELAEGG